MGETMKKLFFAIKFALALVGIFLMIGFGVGSSKGMPDYVQIYVNDAEKIYLAPSCVENKAGLRLTTAAEARTLRYRPDEKCRDEGAFIQDDRSLTGSFLQMIGILKPIPSRWNKDGTWNY